MSMVDPLTPWADGGAADDSRERPLARLFKAVPEPAPLSDVARQRVGARLRRGPRKSPRLFLVRLVAVGVVIGVAGAAGAQWASLRFFGVQRELATPRAQAVAAATEAPRGPKLGLAPAPAAPLAPAEQPTATPVAAATGLAAAPSPLPSSRLGLEATSLERCLTALRAGGRESAQRALTDIDRHLREFAGGALELEARVARVDALLLLGRRVDALRELSALPLERVGRQRELRLIRAELRADADCDAALTDFQTLLAQPLPPVWEERALFGRAGCLLRQGEGAAAARDFTSYLERYPNGRFAAQIRAQTAQTTGPRAK